MATQQPTAASPAATTLTSTPGAIVSAAAAAYSGIDWSDTATEFAGRVGERFIFACPVAGVAGDVWGTETYTSDSSVCTAAVHAGKTSFAEGGVVTIQMSAGEQFYLATTRNGVSTRSYGPWPSSFIFVAQAAP